MGKSLGFLRSGEEVFDRENSHLKLSDELIKEVLGRISSEGRSFIEREVEFGEIVGQTICVETKAFDKIVYARRPKRIGHSKFVLGHSSEFCSSVFVALKVGNKWGEYILCTGFVGEKPQPEPWDWKYFSKQKNPQEAKEKAIDFWKNHALVWGSEEVITGTEVIVCPW